MWDCGLRHPAVLYTLILSCGLRHPAVLHILSVRFWPLAPGCSTYSECEFVALLLRQYCILWVWDCGLRFQDVLHTLSVSSWPYVCGSTAYSECEIVALGSRLYYILWVRVCGFKHRLVIFTLSVRLWLRHPAVLHNLILSCTTYTECDFVAIGLKQYCIPLVWVSGLMYQAVLHSLSLSLWP